MTVTVLMAAGLRSYTNGMDRIIVQAKTLKQVIEEMERMVPGVKARICDETGSIRRLVNIFVNQKTLDAGKAENPEIPDNAVIHIIPSIAGGSSR